MQRRLDCATAILDHELEGAFVAAREMLPEGSRSRDTLERVPIKEK